MLSKPIYMHAASALAGERAHRTVQLSLHIKRGVPKQPYNTQSFTTQPVLGCCVPAQRQIPLTPLMQGVSLAPPPVLVSWSQYLGGGDDHHLVRSACNRISATKLYSSKDVDVCVLGVLEHAVVCEHKSMNTCKSATACPGCPACSTYTQIVA